MARKEKKYHYIYKITCEITGKYYWGMHSTDKMDDKYFGSGRNLRYSINKYGIENHTKEIVEYLNTRKELKEREREIVGIDEVKNTMCLNKIPGGGGYSYPRTDEVRKKISEGMKGKIRTEEHKNNLSKSLSGRTLSDEHKLKLKENHVGSTGYKWTEERKINHSESQKGRQHFLGHSHTDETKLKMSETHKGKRFSEETRLKMSLSKKGRPAWNKNVKQKTVTCPHCNKSGGVVNMNRYHFNKCKLNESTN